MYFVVRAHGKEWKSKGLWPYALQVEEAISRTKSVSFHMHTIGIRSQNYIVIVSIIRNKRSCNVIIIIIYLFDDNT